MALLTFSLFRTILCCRKMTYDLIRKGAKLLMARRKVTIQELSQYCGVSTATISRVINNNGHCSEKTRARVLKAVEEMGYIPDSNAKSLRTKSSHIVGIFINELNHLMTTCLLAQLQQMLFKQGYTPIICEIGYSGVKEQYYFSMLQSINACAIIVIMKQMGSDCLLEANIPVLFLYRNPLPGRIESNHICVIQTDDYSAGTLAGQELLRLGCKHIAEIRVKNTDSRVPLGRHLGLLNYLFRSNMPYDESLEIVADSSEFSQLLEAINQKLDQGYVADGYFCVNDILALALIRALEVHGYRIPEQVKVIGCNDSAIALYNNKQITSIQHSVPEMCAATVDMLKRMLSHEQLSENDRIQTFPVSLVRRATS